MKKFAKFSFLVFIPIVTGVVCLIAGSITGNNTVLRFGMLSLAAGVPATMVILVFIGLILMMTGKLGDGEKSEEEALSQREREQKAIDDINNAGYFESRVNMAEYEARHVAEGMKSAPKMGVILGIGGFFLLVADLIAATVLLINHIFVGAIVCAAIFGGVIVTALIATAVSRAKAMSGDIRKAQKLAEGQVKACFMIGTSTMRTGGNRHQRSNGKAVRMSGVTYRVIINADGEEYGVFSKRFYEPDEKVTIAVLGKKRAKIVEDIELEKMKSE